MKIILTILCAIVVLFGGGCAFILLYDSMAYSGMFSGGIFLAIPIGLAVLNALVIAALWGKKPVRGAFLALVIIDAIIAALMAISLSDPSMNYTDLNMFIIAAIGVVALKGILTFLYWLKLGQSAP